MLSEAKHLPQAKHLAPPVECEILRRFAPQNDGWHSPRGRNGQSARLTEWAKADRIIARIWQDTLNIKEVGAVLWKTLRRE